MKKGTILAVVVMALTVLFIVIGTLWPNSTAIYWSGGKTMLRSPTTPQAAVENLGYEIRDNRWGKAYSSLYNKAEFSQADFREDLRGYYAGLRTFASVTGVQVRPLHSTADTAEMQLKLQWSTVVGPFTGTRIVKVVKVGNQWKAIWPLVKKPEVPPQVIPLTYLRWDVINRGPGDDWGAQNVQSPDIHIVDMHPLQRAEGVVVMGEILNTDVVPAYVSVSATLVGKNGKPLANEDAFDMISHFLLPKQVTPFLINFPGAQLSDVASIQMKPVSALVSASAGPVVAIENLRLNPAPEDSLSGQLMNQGGQVVNIAHVLGTFYDKGGQLVWVAGSYVDRALPPRTPVSFKIEIPQDLVKKISSDRAIVASYRMGTP